MAFFRGQAGWISYNKGIKSQLETKKIDCSTKMNSIKTKKNYGEYV